MTSLFRNDHEAALARLRVLEVENATLRAENERLRTRKTQLEATFGDEEAPSKVMLPVIAFLAVLLVAFIAYLVVRGDG